MKTFLIDYRRPEGREDFKVVEAATAAQAVEIFRAAGCDGWSGFLFQEFDIMADSERVGEYAECSSRFVVAL